jgi:GntR family transcriptional regulator
VASVSQVMIHIDVHASEPSYRQLAGILRARIQSGEVSPREPLPSITTLVQETGLAVGTVRKAIGVLVDEGLAYTVPGRGTFARLAAESIPLPRVAVAGVSADPLGGPDPRSSWAVRALAGIWDNTGANPELAHQID